MGVAEKTPVWVGVIVNVAVTGEVSVYREVTVGIGFSGVSVQASQPIQ